MTHLKVKKITKKRDYPPAHRLNVNVLQIHFFVIFAVLDVSFAVNSCLNRIFYIYVCSFITSL